jgi:hypothetical protein
VSYRDDLEAAQARAEAAERRVADLEKALATSDEPMLTIPRRLRVTSTVHELAVRWRRSDVEHAWFLLVVGVFLLVASIVWFGMATVLFGPLGLAMAYQGLRPLINQTTISLQGDELRVRRGPIPSRGNVTLRIADVKQLFVEQDGSDFGLCAVLDDERVISLVDDIQRKGEAQYLEQVFERRLRIKDRRLVGEAPK